MKKITFKLLILVLFITFSNCENAKKLDYKYSENPKVLACDFPNGNLYNEAVHSFENDIINTYDKTSKSGPRAYTTFLNAATRGNLKIEEIASAHSLNIAHLLKEENNLWIKSNKKTVLNYSHPLVDCMVNNIKTTRIKQTMNALLSTNSMKPNLILPPLSANARGMQGDGSLKAFVAFDFFYSKLLDTTLENLKNPNPQSTEAAKTDQNVDFNKVPRNATPANNNTEKDPHAGHNH